MATVMEDIQALEARYVLQTYRRQPVTLVRGHPSLDDIVLFDRSAGVRGFRDVRRQLRRRGPFDVCINLQVYFKAGIITGFTRAPIKLGFDRARARDLNWLFTNRKIAPSPVQHVQDQYFEFLDYLRVPHDVVEWNLGPWPSERDWQRQFASQLTKPAASRPVARWRRSSSSSR